MKKKKTTLVKYIYMILLIIIAYNCSNDSTSSSDDEIIVDDDTPVIDDDDDDDDDGIEFTTINSIEEFVETLNQNDLNIKLASGTYRFGPEHIDSGIIPFHEMFVFRGNNSNYDFKDVIFEFETELWSAYGNEEVVQVRLYGDNITVKNLTILDIGSSAPSFRCRNIHFDGTNNTVDGFHITTSGSSPYGYGDLFGKGGSSVISHNKHSGILIRGENNTLKNTTLLHRSYGHGIFIQGGKNVLIDNCYVEGDEMRTTDDVLAEEGTGSAADNVNFMTVWGYKVPPGYMISKQEDGIRTYANGVHYITGETSTTENITIKNCTVKRMRSGYSLAFGSGDFLVENCTSIENESGLGMRSGGRIINSRSDAKYGIAYGNAYESDNNITAQIEILKSDSYYGPHPLAYIGGSDHHFTFTSEVEDVSQEKSIQIGGDKRSLRTLEDSNPSQNNHTTRTTFVNNDSNYPVNLTNVSIGTNLLSCGTVTDEGSVNTINTPETCN